MKATTALQSSRPRTLVWLGILLILLVIAVKYIIGEVKYYSLNEEVMGRFWGVRWWLIGHLTGGILALVIGPFQFWTYLRTRFLRLHRLLGKFYLGGILVASLSSTYMAWNTALAIHWTWAVALQVLAFVWFCTAAMAFRAIRLRRIQQHKEWMIRSYVVTFAFVLFRWLVYLPAVVALGNFIERGPTIGFLSFVIPLFVTEVALQWNKK